MIAVPALVLGALGSACSDPAEGSGSDGTPLTTEQAQRLAESLHRNYEAGGAAFTLSARLPDGSSLVLEGEIDFVGHIGQAVVQATGAEAAVTEVVWSDAAVLERRPELNERLAESGRGLFAFVARAPDPDGRDLDALLGVITGLASERADNALLVQQQAGSAWLRADELRGSEADVMRYGDRTIYWLDASTGALLRFEGDTELGNRPFVIDLTNPGPRSIVGPAAAAVVDIDDVRDLYEVSEA